MVRRENWNSTLFLIHPRYSCLSLPFSSSVTRPSSYRCAHDAGHFVAAVEETGHRTVIAEGKAEAAFGRWKPVSELIRVGRLLVLDVDHQFAVSDVQVAALEHVAVDRVAVDLVVDEVAALVVERKFPELGDRRQIVHVEGERVLSRARERLTVCVDRAERARVRTHGNRRPDGPQPVVALLDVVI